LRGMFISVAAPGGAGTMARMLRTQLDVLFDDILRSRRLLAHPFYRRWEAGTLGQGELASYAGQYRHFEAVLPEVLERIVEGLPEGRARSLVQANLDDERGVPAPHLELFDTFAAAVGAGVSDPTAATTALIDLYRSEADRSPVAALSAVAAYEVQAPSIAASKAAGLLAWYGLDDDGARFWDVHAGVDGLHGTWMLDALGLLTDNSEEIAGPATAAADAWWAFLDEREAVAPVSAAC